MYYRKPVRHDRHRRRPRRLWGFLPLVQFPWVGTALLLALLMAVDSDAGRDLLGRALTAATAGRMLVDGIGGDLPFRPRIDRLELADADGVWLRATDLALRLRPAALVRGELDIEALTLDRLELGRLPEANGGARSPLPVAVRLRELVIAKLILDGLGPETPPLTVTGHASLAAEEVAADLRLTMSERLGGRFAARLVLEGGEPVPVSARVSAEASALRLPFGLTLGALALHGEMRDLFGPAQLDARVQLTELSTGEMVGNLDIRARGPFADIEVEADAEARFPPLGGQGPGDARVALAGRVEPGAQRLELSRLRLESPDRRLTLLAPAVIAFGDGLTLQAVRFGLASGRDADPDPVHGPDHGPAAEAAGRLELSGRVVPEFSIEARVAHLDLATFAPGLPPLLTGLEGRLDAQAHLAGTASAPTGQVEFSARDLALASARGFGLPPAAARLTLTSAGATTRLAAEIGMDERARLTLDGRIGGAIRSPGATLDLRGGGQVDLALLDAWLGASGRRAEGRVGLDLTIGGTWAAPSPEGSLRITHGALRDRRMGLWLDDIAGDATLRRDRLRIERLAAKAGTGTFVLAGSLDWQTPGQTSGQTLDLRLSARDAEPLRRDQLNLRVDADLALRGALGEALSLTGDLRFAEVDIRLPERLPPDIPTLDVVELGERRQARLASRARTGGDWPSRLRLDLDIDAPNAIRVRGHNIDAELGGRVRLLGSADAPLAEGGFTLLRGDYRLLGLPLRFTRGRLGLDGADLLDPTLDFEARAQSGGSTAILAVEGRARSPQLVLRGEPDMPDEEVLSRLLFGVPPARLSGLQLARVGLAMASITDLGSDDPGLLGRARAGLGLERLRLDSDEGGQAVVEGGRRLSERVYLGARHRMSSGDTQAVFGVQVAPQIRFESDVSGGGAGAGAAFELDY